ncbi:MAG: hypothetical protein HY805_04570 [Nitrospirae bacterium]|nr:hypothetical protein [Nitrospirota bacterium]
MKRFMKRLENLFTAITFAEAGEHETARQILKEVERKEEKQPELLQEKRKSSDGSPAPARS